MRAFVIAFALILLIECAADILIAHFIGAYDAALFTEISDALNGSR